MSRKRSTGKDREGRGPQRVGDLLPSFLEDRGLREPVLQVDVLEEWPSRVGEAIAGVTRARSVKDGCLVVEVRSSAWLMELSFMKGEILRRLNDGREEGRVEKIVFALAEE